MRRHSRPTLPHIKRTSDLVFGFAVTGQASAGDGFTARLGYDGNVVEDQIVQTL